MATWSYVHSLNGEHVEYLSGHGVVLPSLALGNRAPGEEDLQAAYAEVGSPAELTVDAYAGETELTVALRGDGRQALSHRSRLGASDRRGLGLWDLLMSRE